MNFRSRDAGFPGGGTLRGRGTFDGKSALKDFEKRESGQARILSMTWPCTSVRRKFRPLYL